MYFTMNYFVKQGIHLLYGYAFLNLFYKTEFLFTVLV